MKACVEKADKQGIFVGVHTLYNFITTNDPYGTPVPDKRLGKVGSSLITEDISESTTEISIESPGFFNQYKNNSLHTVMIGSELIRYEEVSEPVPLKLLGCQRGAWNTKKNWHKKGQIISKLADHAYKVFLTDPDLTVEIAKRTNEKYK